MGWWNIAAIVIQMCQSYTPYSYELECRDKMHQCLRKRSFFDEKSLDSALEYCVEIWEYEP